MNNSSIIAKRMQLKFSHCLILLFLLFFEMFLPIKGWTQSFSDTGVFYFSSTHNPLRSPIFREFLPGEGLKVGRAQIHPFLGVAEVFTDNVFRTDTRRKSDFLTTIAPGIQALLPFGGGKHSLLLDYRAAQFLYSKFDENNVYAQTGAGRAAFKFPGGLEINFQGGHVEGFDPRGSAVDIQAQDITKWRATSILGNARLRGPRGSIRLRSRYTRLHYKNNGQDSSRDRKNARARFTVFLEATPTVSALFGARISNNSYDQNKQLDSFSYGVFTGFELAPSRLLSGEVRVGYSILNFDRAPIIPLDPAPVAPAPIDKGNQLLNDGLSLGGKQQERLTLNGRLYWRPTTRRSFRLRAFRNIRQSAVFDTSSFVQTGVSIQATQQVTDRFGLRGSFLYSNSNFKPGRTDNRFRGRIGLRYRTVQWLGFTLNYYFAKRTSTESQFEFYSNTISVSAQALF